MSRTQGKRPPPRLVRTPHSLSQLKQYLYTLPGTLATWEQNSGRSLIEVATDLNYWASLQDNEGGALPVDYPYPRAAALGTRWAMKHTRPGAGVLKLPRPSRPTDAASLELWETAYGYNYLRDDLREVESGVRAIEFDGSHVRLPYHDNIPYYAFDKVLDECDLRAKLVQHRTHYGDLRSFTMPDLPATYKSLADMVSWFEAPSELRNFCRDVARDDSALWSDDLTPTTVLPGKFTLDDLHAYWIELSAIAMFTGLLHQATVPYPSADTQAAYAPIYTRVELIEGIAEAVDIPQSLSEQITTLFTMDKAGPVDATLTPLIPWRANIMLMNSLIRATDPRRSMFQIMKACGLWAGPIPSRMGHDGEQRVRNVLDERLAADVLRAYGVKIPRTDGSLAGELDVLLCSPREKLVVAIEVIWYPPTSNRGEATHRRSRYIPKKRDQLERLRNRIHAEQARPAAGKVAEWPDLSTFDWRYFVLTRDVLPHAPLIGAIPVSSFRLLNYALPRAVTLTRLVHLLDNPTLPDSWPRSWRGYKYGTLDITAETIEAAPLRTD